MKLNLGISLLRLFLVLSISSVSMLPGDLVRNGFRQHVRRNQLYPACIKSFQQLLAFLAHERESGQIKPCPTEPFATGCPLPSAIEFLHPRSGQTPFENEDQGFGLDVRADLQHVL